MSSDPSVMDEQPSEPEIPKCENCGSDPSKPSAGNKGPICKESPYHARQPMWACRFGLGPYDAYHASHSHDAEGMCDV